MDHILYEKEQWIKLKYRLSLSVDIMNKWIVVLVYEYVFLTRLNRQTRCFSLSIPDGRKNGSLFRSLFILFPLEMWCGKWERERPKGWMNRGR